MLSPELGTAPRVYYLHKPKRFVAATVVDKEADEVVEGARATLRAPTDGATTAVCVQTSSATCGSTASSRAVSHVGAEGGLP